MLRRFQILMAFLVASLSVIAPEALSKTLADRLMAIKRTSADVMPDAVDWTDTSCVLTTATKTISGITTNIQIKIEIQFLAGTQAYVLNGTQIALTALSTTITVANGDTLAFAHSYINGQTYTIKNASNGDALIDTVHIGWTVRC